jgi:hypothetical protein
VMREAMERQEAQGPQGLARLARRAAGCVNPRQRGAVERRTPGASRRSITFPEKGRGRKKRRGDPRAFQQQGQRSVGYDRT